MTLYFGLVQSRYGPRAEYNYYLTSKVLFTGGGFRSYCFVQLHFFFATILAIKTVHHTQLVHLYLSASSGPEPLAGYCHPSHIVRQTGGNTCGLTFAFLPTDRSGHDRLFLWGFTGFDGWRSQRQTRGLGLAAKHETGKLLRDYADENSCLIFGPDSPTTNPKNPSVTPISWTS